MEKKYDKIVISIIITTILVLGYLIFSNIRKNKEEEIIATIKETGSNYVIAISEDKQEYLINTKNNYNIGDKINVTMKNIKKTSPIQGEIVKIDTISKTVEFVITDEPIIKNEEITNETKTEPNIDNSYKEQHTPQEQVATEEDIIAYFSNTENEVNNSTSFKDSLKEKFVTLVDFLFYDGEIKGKTFKELSNKTKLKVLEIFLKIDNKLDNKFPNYKENISNTGNKVYTNVKTKAIETYLNLTTEICANDASLCESAKEGLRTLKESFSLTWDFIKEMSGVGLTKLKNWYEIWREI